jgi:hypothetical protein
MSTYAAEIAGDYNLHTRVQVAVVAKAYAFSQVEPEDNRRDFKRRQLASSVLLDPRSRVESFSWAVVSSLSSDFSGNVDDITDQQITSAVQSAWDIISNVSGGDETASNAVFGPSQAGLAIMSLHQTIADLQSRLDAANL